MKSELNIAIVSTNRDKYSETFIHSHIRHLPGTIHVLSDGYLPAQFSRDRGLSAEPLPLKKSWPGLGIKKDEKELLQQAIEKYLRDHKIDAVLCEYGPSGVEMMGLCEKLAIPLVVHFHGYDAYRRDVLESYGRQYPELFSKAAAIVAVSRHMQAQLLRLGCPGEKLHFIPYGIDPALFKPDVRQQKAITFLTCGRFVAKKAPQLSIKAFALVAEQLPDAKLVMIGDGELLPECKALVKALGLEHAVEFAGVKRPADVAGIMQHAQVFIQHSITTGENDSEGTPLSILEAGASGLPVVATRHGGISDVIEDGENGFLVPEGDVEGMAQRLLQLAADPSLAAQMGEKARAGVSAHYTLDRYIQKLYALADGVVR